MQKMQLNFHALATRFGRHLYPEPEIFIRELIQNAHDAIQLRRVRDPACAGRIYIALDSHRGAIVVTDDGEGMSHTIIEEYLATIGASGTNEMHTVSQRMGCPDVPTIGRFGIGLLSTFAVADRVDIFTRYMGSEEAWHWSCGADGGFTLHPAPDAGDGTQVIVTLNTAFSDLLDETEIDRVIRAYADYLPLPIFLNQRGPVNAMRFPWEPTTALSASLRNPGLGEFIERHYWESPLLVIPVDLPRIQTRGFLFLADPNTPEVLPESQIDLYQERMFLRTCGSELLPQWPWLRGMLNTRALQPNAARDDALWNEAWHALRQALSEIVGDAIHSGAEMPPFPKRMRFDKSFKNNSIQKYPPR